MIWTGHDLQKAWLTPVALRSLTLSPSGPFRASCCNLSERMTRPQHSGSFKAPLTTAVSHCSTGMFHRYRNAFRGFQSEAVFNCICLTWKRILCSQGTHLPVVWLSAGEGPVLVMWGLSEVWSCTCRGATRDKQTCPGAKGRKTFEVAQHSSELFSRAIHGLSKLFPQHVLT